jgi:CHRD domain/PEP-CTERM motif
MMIRPHPLALAAAATLALVASAPALAHIQAFGGTYVTEGGGGRTGSGTLYMEYEEETNTLAITTTFAGLSGNTTVAHIHCCTAAANMGNAGVALAGGAGGSLISFPVGVKGATYNQNFDLGLNSVYGLTFFNNNGATANGARDALLGAFMSGKAYFNIHTSPTFGGGEIRAWITPTTVVPEPGTWGLMALGLAGVAAAARRRQTAH